MEKVHKLALRFEVLEFRDQPQGRAERFRAGQFHQRAKSGEPGRRGGRCAGARSGGTRPGFCVLRSGY